MEKDPDKTWSDVYDSPADILKFCENVNIHKEFLNVVGRPEPVRILEVGCGSGTLSVFMSHLGNDVTAVDRDEVVLDRAVKASRSLNGNVKFVKADAFNLPFRDKEFDVAFSQGVVEHFSDGDMLKLLREQLRVAKKVFFSVPNKAYKHKDFGNERLMTKEQWEKILSGFNIFVSESYYRVRTKKNFLMSLPIMYMAGIE